MFYGCWGFRRKLTVTLGLSQIGLAYVAQITARLSIPRPFSSA